MADGTYKPDLSGNKGEWSEIYVFLRLLEIGKLYAADENLNKMNDVFYNIIKILRQENIGKLEFRVNQSEDTITIINTTDESVLGTMPVTEFKAAADKLYSEITKSQNNTKGAFSLRDTEAFLDNLGISSLKAPSEDKADIRIKIHDINSGFESVQGFSIKSRLGGPSTLINAGKTTNFIFEVNGPINDEIMSNFNTCSKKFKDKFTVLHNNACDIEYVGMENSVFEGNLMLIDGDLPKICGYMLKSYYSSGLNKVIDSLNSITETNPLNYNLSNGHPFYSYKFKRMLSECALGMLPGKTWDGIADATGGYIIVREDGEVLCYHLFNHNEFENYLLQNTKFETASTSRHQFGTIYKENNKYYLKLNLQIRFIK
ncbi:HpaII family restriction endonuclease [Ruminococcus bovis]|uniref:HpaII family restriction endonuclease n=2 Tax=Ruminococcus bovis TaxID=2564099 RepID=A0A4P8Y3S1_9FIRM|nr:HpaII family restriction endonuclease [Ruminococcus bovis]